MLKRINGKKEQIREALSPADIRILILGLSLGLVFLTGLLLSFIWFPKQAQTLAGMTTTNMLFGRAAGMSLGYAGGLNHLTVILINLLIETIQVLIFYPLFVLSWHHLLEIKILKKSMKRIHKAAEKRKAVIEKFGLIGLLIFVWFPFWMTGPVVGSVIGFMIGLRPWINMGVVLGGTGIAIAGWAFVLRSLHEWAAEYSTFIPAVIVLSIVFVVLLRYFYSRWKALLKKYGDGGPMTPIL